MNSYKRIISIISIFTILFLTLPIDVLAENFKEYPINMTVYVDGKEGMTVRAMDLYYDNYRYVSMRDIASALSGTGKCFEMAIGDKIYVSTGQEYGPCGGENVPYDATCFEADYMLSEALKRNLFEKDGTEYKYFSFITQNSANKYDCFMAITDLAMFLNLNIRVEGNDIFIDTTKPFLIDIDDLNQNNYFFMCNSVLVGDVTTGEIFYSYNADESVAMASTTKLMTYILVMDAVSRGDLTLNDNLYISYNAERLSKGVDGVIALNEGDYVNINDALVGMLIPSSNELALVLAEAVAGSEDAFVEMMNAKAVEIGLSEDTQFYNCCGLPYFENGTFNNKIQNRISANDMFKLVTYLMNIYPQVTDITSKDELFLESLDQKVVNTNPMLLNMPGTVGLKTGTTNKAGNCLISLYACDVNGETHYIVAVELGAENNMMRSTISELLLHYGIQELIGVDVEPQMPTDNIPTDPENLIRIILNH